MRNDSRGLEGFTLIDLLTVIAIIAILAAILLPVLNRAKANANRATCANNLHQIDLAIRVYSDEANDTSPSIPGTGHVWAGYKGLVQSYLGLGNSPTNQNPLFVCPADVFSYAGYNSIHFVPHGRHERPSSNYSSYFFNGGNEFTNAHPRLLGIAGLKLTAIKHPARTILVNEWAAIIPFSWHEPKQPITDVKNSAYNNARDIVGYVDGHVSYIKMYWRADETISLQYDPPTDYDYQWSGT